MGAVGIGESGVGTAQTRSAGVHHGNELRHRAADVLRHSVGGVTAGGGWWGNGQSFTGSFLMGGAFNPRLPQLYSSAVFVLEAE